MTPANSRGSIITNFACIVYLFPFHIFHNLDLASEIIAYVVAYGISDDLFGLILFILFISKCEILLMKM